MTLPASLRVTANGSEYSAAEAAVAAVRIDLSAAGRHDAAVLLLWRDSCISGLSPGDDLAVALGEAGSETAVWTGTVTEVESAADGVRIAGLAPTAVLSRTWRSQAYLQQGVAEIVEDLAADVEVDRVECDLRLESYCVDSRLDVWRHLEDLAALSGSSLASSPAGALRFTPSAVAAGNHQLHHGIDLLSWRLSKRPRPAMPAHAAHGAASEQGNSRWHWLRNDPAPGADRSQIRVIGSFHSKDAAEALAAATEAAAGRGETAGEVQLWGRPEVRPGDHLQLTGLPGGDSQPIALPLPGASGGDQVVRVVEVGHRLEARRGFVTTCRVEGGEAAGGGLLGALGL